MNEAMDEAMDEKTWQDICAAYGLGTSDGPLQAVTGGLKHRLYRARTAQGEYAVKVLNPRLLREPGRMTRYERAEQIAQAAARAGLPAVLALPGPDGPVQVVGPATVMVFPWLSGTTLPPAPAPPDAARRVGALLGRLHALTPEVAGLEPPAPPRFSDAHWSGLARRARAEGAAWAGAVSAALPHLAAWSENARQARAALGDDWVATHRDMDQKNVLWSDPHTPLLLDWEEAGAMNPLLEVMGAALNWAGQAAGSPAEAPFACLPRRLRERRAPKPRRFAPCRRRRPGQVAGLARLQLDSLPARRPNAAGRAGDCLRGGGTRPGDPVRAGRRHAATPPLVPKGRLGLPAPLHRRRSSR